MSATKEWLITLEEKCWDQVADIVGECEHVNEAMVRAAAIFSQAGLLGYLTVQDIDEGVGEMWNEKWSAYV
jgi:hypothetical protein